MIELTITCPKCATELLKRIKVKREATMKPSPKKREAAG